VAEDREKRITEADEVQQQDEGEDVEAHKHRFGAEDKTIAATEEGPDVEGHAVRPKHGH
jgi:hypothetical protein